MRPSLDRLAVAYHATSWALGREACALLPLEALASPSVRRSWGAQAEMIGQALAQVAPALARDGRIVQLVDGGMDAVVSTVIGGARAGCRLLGVDLADADGPGISIVEMLPPGGRLPPGARTRANVGLDPVAGGAGDASVVPSGRLFAPPERFEDRPFSAEEAARVVTASAVETLCERGEPARYERLLGEILIGLDRSGQLHRLVADDHGSAPPDVEPEPGPDPVERVMAIIRDELERPTQRRVKEIEPGRWWLIDPNDLSDTAVPLSDRVEWAAFSLLSTAGPMTEAAFLDRMVTMFSGRDMADDSLIRACLESYGRPTGEHEQIVTDDDLLARSQEHTELLGAIAEAGHRLGMRVWIGRREQTRRLGGRSLGDILEGIEQRPNLGSIGPAVDQIAEIDAIWYVRGKLAFMFEVEWTAMLGEPLLRRHALIPANDAIVRFLVIAPERAELVRHKLEASPLLRAALEAGTWHIIRSDHLRSFLARDPLQIGDLEPYLGLDPLVGRSAEQMPLFQEGPA